MPDSFPNPRTQMHVRFYRLGEERDDLSTQTTPEQRIEMVWLLSTRMWELTGRPMPTYTRATMPVRVIRP